MPGRHQLLYLERDIRKSALASGFQTKAGQTLSAVLESCDARPIVCQIDLSSIKSVYFPGCSIPSPAFGFDPDDMAEMLAILGRDPRVRVITLTEFNPAIEKGRSGKLIAKQLLSSFLAQVTLR